MTVLSAAWAIFRKDVRAEIRTRETAGTSLVFALLSILTFSFALDPIRTDPMALVPGVLWVTVFFAGILSLGRSMAAEQSQDALQGLLISPAEPEGIYLGKLLANLAFSGAVEAVGVPVLFALFRVPFPAAWGHFVAVLVLGTVGFVAAGTLLAAVAASARTRELLLPLLLLPVVVPVAIAAVEATAALVANLPPSEWETWIRVLGVFDTLMLALPQLLFRYVLEG